MRSDRRRLWSHDVPWRGLSPAHRNPDPPSPQSPLDADARYFEDLRLNAFRYAIDGIVDELGRRGFRINWPAGERSPKRTSVDRQVLISCASDAAREIYGYTHVDAKADAAMGVARDLLESYAHWLGQGRESDAAFMMSAILAEFAGFVLSQELPRWGW